ncbi:MAG: hypothetical protein KY464_03765 [Gemmatimonadetes bacterium]|nr:hypothetical protein [Gemmatimonadota bacterium]
MHRSIQIRGKGTVHVVAYGIADAEHLLEKELRALWPEARVRIIELRRAPSTPRIVEEFSLSYQLDAQLEVDGADEKAARSAAFRAAREKLAASRYAQTRWEGVRHRPPA